MGADAVRRAERIVAELRFRLAGLRSRPVPENDVQCRSGAIVLTLTIGEAEAVVRHLGRGGL